MSRKSSHNSVSLYQYKQNLSIETDLWKTNNHHLETVEFHCKKKTITQTPHPLFADMHTLFLIASNWTDDMHHKFFNPSRPDPG